MKIPRDVNGVIPPTLITPSSIKTANASFLRMAATHFKIF
jgi:hypothetical protein